MSQFQIPISSVLDEETARAEVYGLLATLLHAAPSPELHAKLQVAVTQAPAAGALLEGPWSELVAASRTMTCSDISQEFDALFVSVGKPEVTLFGSYYLSGFLNEKPLVVLRTDIAELGLACDETLSVTEDHVAYVFEVMRYLIAGDDVAISNLTRQRAFFARHVQSWLPAMCESLASHPKSVFYKTVAVFAEAFINVESQGFDMLE